MAVYLPMKRAVVIGGCGYVGRHVCMALSRLGFQVLQMDVMPPSLAFHNKVAKLTVPILFQHIDIAKEGHRLAEVLTTFQPEIVISVAGWGMSGSDMLSPMCHAINVKGTENILAACKTAGVQFFIFTSTYNVVFGGQEILDGNEESAYFPQDQHTDEYSKSKALAEQLVLEANGQTVHGGKSLCTAVLRPAAIYGETEQRHLPRIVKHIDQGLFLFKIGAAMVDWVYIDNLVQAYVLCTQKMLAQKTHLADPAGQVYFVSDGTPIENFEFFRPLVRSRKRVFPSITISTYTALCLAWLLEDIYAVSKFLGYPIPPFLTRAEVLKVGVSHYFSIAKAQKELGYAPVLTSVEGAERIGQHYAKFYTSSSYFEFAPLVFYVLIILGMALTAMSAFSDSGWGDGILVDISCRFLGNILGVAVGGAVGGLLDLIDAFALLVFRSRAIVTCVFWAAVAAHVGEAIVALDVASRLCPSQAWKWGLQTFLLGYPSLSLIQKRYDLDFSKKNN